MAQKVQTLLIDDLDGGEAEGIVPSATLPLAVAIGVLGRDFQQFRRTEGFRQRTEGRSCFVGRIDPWVRLKLRQCAAGEEVLLGRL